MGFKCGIVGLPNVGKSTLFNALTRSKIQAENYPFCTIDPNVGIVPVPDPRLDRIAGIVQPKSLVPTTIEFVDIAGLVAGASQGEGLGNQFLAHIREVDAVAQVVRCFEDANVTHVSGTIDPAADIEVIATELALADLQTVEKGLDKATKASKAGDKEQLKLKALLTRVREQLDTGQAVRSMVLSDDERTLLRPLFLLTMKPTLYITNVDEAGIQGNAQVDAVRALVESEGGEVVPVCAKIEAELSELSDDDRAEFLADLELEEPGLNRVIRAGYRLLNMQTYFTAGPKEVRAWTVPVGATAPQAAGVIHTDFERGFIRAEVTAYDDFVACKGEQGAREAGKLRVEGKDYVLADGDVIFFRFNV